MSMDPMWKLRVSAADKLWGSLALLILVGLIVMGILLWLL